MKLTFDIRTFLTVKTQFICMLISFVCMFFMLYKAVIGFYPGDKLPAANDYNIKSFFEKFHVNPSRIDAGITLLNFLTFNSSQNDFTFDAMMSFDYNPQEISPKVVDRFEFTRAKFLDKYIRDEVKVSETHTRVEYYVKVNFSVDFFNYKRFPVDDHIISFNLINPGTDAKETMYDLKPKDFILSSNFSLPGWKIACHQSVPGFRLHEDGDNVAEPVLTFSICLIKYDFRHIALIIFPLFLIFFGGFFAFSVSNIRVAIEMARSSVFGLLAYDYVIISLSPVTAYFMLSDYIFLLFLTASFAMYLILFWCSKMPHYKHLLLIKSLSVITILVILNVSWFYLISFMGL